MSDLIINLRGPDKSHTDKYRYHLINITYQTQDTKHNTMKYNHSVGWNTTPEKQSVESPNMGKQSVEQL